MKNHIIAATFAVSALGAQASEKFEVEKIQPNDPRITAMCKQFNQKTGILLNNKEICEYSIDNGQSWIEVKSIAMILAALSLGGALIWRSRKKKGEIGIQDQPQNLRKTQEPTANTPTEGNTTKILQVVEGLRTMFGDALKNLKKPQKPLTNEEPQIEEPIKVIHYTAYDENEPNVAKLERWLKEEDYTSTETQLRGMLYQYPGNTGLYIKKLKLLLAQGKAENFKEVYVSIMDIDDPDHKLIPVDIRNLIRDWGRTLDPQKLEPLYWGVNDGVTDVGVGLEESDIDSLTEVIDDKNELESRNMRHILGTQFNSTLHGSETLAFAYSNGGKDFMEDHVISYMENDRVVVIALDGVTEGKKGTTEQFVKALGEDLRSSSLEEAITRGYESKFPDEVGATAGKIVIENGNLRFEKIGDIGILIFDKNGNISLRNIGGGFIPDDWFGSEDLVDTEEGEDILENINQYFHKDLSLEEGMKKGEFMRKYQAHTRQISINSNDTNVSMGSYELRPGDTVLMGTDGIFDNMSLEHIIDTIGKSSANQGSIDLLRELDTLAYENKGDFGGKYKEDNIGFSIYKHPNESGIPSITQVEDVVFTELPGDETVSGVLTEEVIAPPEEVVLDMETVKKELQGKVLTGEALVEFKSSLSTEKGIYKRIRLPQTSAARKLGFELGENQDGVVTIKASKPGSTLYYLENEGVVQTTEHTLSNVAAINTPVNGYIEVVLRDFTIQKILLTHKEVLGE